MKQVYTGIVERVANATTQPEVLKLVEEATKFGDISPKTLRRVKRKAQSTLKSLIAEKESKKKKVEEK